MIERQCLYFTAERQVELRREQLPDLPPDQLLVETLFSAISPGTELLVYRGQAPAELDADPLLESLPGKLAYPLPYGYAAVGRVLAAGAALEPGWVGRLVFSFQPHQTHFLAPTRQVMLLPDGMQPQTAVFLPNMETALNLVMDGRPMIGERVAIFGLGVIGLLTAALLARFPLQELIALDYYPNRRAAAQELGVGLCLDPAVGQTAERVRGRRGLDLAIEISGAPAALDQAIAVTGFGGRIMIGSWYGQKRANLNLGGSFHRSRIQLISSQVSSLDPALRGSWDKARRFELAWEMLRSLQPERWITQRLPFSQAALGYQLLDQHPEQAIQVIFDYSL